MQHTIAPPEFAEREIDDIADEFVRDVLTGYPGTDIHAGIIGEIGIEGRGKNGRPRGIASIAELTLGDEKLYGPLRASRGWGTVLIPSTGRHACGIGAAGVIHGILDLLEEEGTT